MEEQYYRKQAARFTEVGTGYVAAECNSEEVEIVLSGDMLSLFTICKAILSRISAVTSTTVDETLTALESVCGLPYADAYRYMYGEKPKPKVYKGENWKEQCKRDATIEANKRNAALDTENAKLRRECEMLQNVIKALKENEGKQVKEREKQNKALQKEIRELKHKIRCLEERNSYGE